jgi:hypothetical protein
LPYHTDLLQKEVGIDSSLCHLGAGLNLPANGRIEDREDEVRLQKIGVVNENALEGSDRLLWDARPSEEDFGKLPA